MRSGFVMTQMPALFALYAMSAAVYGVLSALALPRRSHHRVELWFLAACLMTSAWAAAVALAWFVPGARLAAWLEIARSACWYGFILRIYRQSLGSSTHVRTVFQPAGMLALLVLSGCALLRWIYAAPVPELEVIGRIGFAVCGILLLENLYRNTPAEMRWNINLLCVGLGSVFAYDIVLYADGALFRRLSAPLVAAQAPVMILVAPLLALAVARCRRWAADIRISQDVTFHSVTLIGCGTFLLAIALIGEVLRSHGPDWGSVVETTLIFAGVLAVSVVMTSGSARSRIRGLVVENFFRFRYDYRKEWMRCVDTLTAPEAFVALHRRAIRAAAEVVDSPAGAMFVRPPRDVAFQWVGSWNMPAVVHPIPPSHRIVPLFGDGNSIVRIEDHAHPAAWFPDLPRAWIALPLNHFGTLIGFVVLARPRARFTLDREACDLLRVIGREIASRVAEQRAEQVVRQTRDLREYSQRFAFVIHDIKNVAGQLSMLMTNAEQHAGNSEFQRDMLTTVRAAVGKITRLLSRLEADRHERHHAIVTPSDRIPALAQGCSQAHECEITLLDRSAGTGTGIDPDTFDTVVTHLLNNAAEASPPGAPVTVDLHPDAATLVIDIIDCGPGMTPEFVRDELFRPLRSTKGGHGIGAFQARELLRDAGGDLLVLSRPSHGTTMRIILPRIRADLTELIEA